MKKLRAALSFLLAFAAGGTDATGRLATGRAVAAIRHSAAMGDYVVFSFPKDPFDSDRAEISDLIESDVFGGSVFQGGGSPGAPICAKFSRAKSVEELRVTVSKIIPKLDALMRDIANGVPIQKPKPRKIMDKHGKEWPECVPPDPNDRFGEFNNNLNVNGTAYRCSAEGRWIVDERGMAMKRDYLRSRSELLAALTQRKLTREELMRIEPSLNVRDMEPYHAAEKYAEMYDALIVQWELQTGTALPVKTPLSRARGKYGRSPQEDDNRRAVGSMIATLQAMSEAQ